MAKVIAFILGVLTGLAFTRIPHWYFRGDEPETPEDWKPKYRHWRMGVPYFTESELEDVK
jgi:hypothetical protein